MYSLIFAFPPPGTESENKDGAGTGRSSPRNLRVWGPPSTSRRTWRRSRRRLLLQRLPPRRNHKRGSPS
jgi:hypothetical protein